MLFDLRQFQLRLLWVTLFTLLVRPVIAQPLPDGDSLISGINKQFERDIIDHAFPNIGVKWPSHRVFVCWEENDPKYAKERKLVRKAIRDSWESHSGLKFGTDDEKEDWGFCSMGFEGIRIHIEDVGPNTVDLGNRLATRANGMVLNFTYKNWSPKCQHNLDFCDRSIAVHEFGHAIGFAHEQNRPDTRGECAQLAQGANGDTLSLTPWDIHSVMNYCNPEYANNGELSHFDIVAVQYIYGMPQ
jgi:Astacin (Peptidase family M12A)